MSHPRALAAPLLLSLLAGSLLPAAARQSPPAVRESVQVRLVNLDVVAVDRDGDPVRGLRPADFRLQVDGRRLPVTHLTEGEQEKGAISERLTVVAFVDNRHLLRRHRDAALVELADALEVEMRENETWALVVTLGEEMKLLQRPTREIGLAVQGLEAAGEQGVVVPEAARLQRFSMEAVRETLTLLTRTGSAYRAGKSSLGSMFSQLLMYGKAESVDTGATLDALLSLVESLAFVPGRKALFYVADGVAMSPLDRISNTVEERLFGSRHYEGDDLIERRSQASELNDPNHRPSGSDRIDSSRAMEGEMQVGDDGAAAFQQNVAQLDRRADFERLVALANTHRVTFYTLKPPVADASASGLGERAADQSSIRVLSDVRFALDYLAETTGGVAFTAEGDIGDFLRQARRDLQSYYSLAFEPPDTPAGELHRIRLKSRTKGIRLRYRESFLSTSLESRLSDRTWGTLLLDWPDNQHGLALDFGEPTPRGERFLVELVCQLPIRRLSLLPRDGRLEGRFVGVVQVLTEDGRRLPQQGGFFIGIPESEWEVAKDQLYAVRFQLELPAGRHRVAVGLWETSSGAASFVLDAIEVAAAEAPVARSGPRASGRAAP